MSPDKEIVRHEVGTAKISELKSALHAVWKDEILARPAELKKAARALGVEPADLKKLSKPPVALDSGRAGMTGGEVLVVMAVWAGSEIVLGAFKDLAKEELKRRLKQLWSDALEPAVRSQLKDHRYGLGRRIEGKKKKRREDE
jgi:hypothetical protein